jgi:CelD/BcsL family acetyltransferase involved in cellulose biosynthesis
VSGVPALEVSVFQRTPPADVVREWRALAVEAENPYALPDWNEAWCANFRRDRPHIVVCRRAADGALVGVVALVTRDSGRRRTLLLPGDSSADFFAPACLPADTAAVAAALVGELARARHPYELWRLERCLGGSEWLDALLAAARSTGLTVLPWRAEPSLVAIDLDAGPTMSGRQRRDVGRLRRRLEAEHTVVVRTSDGPQEAVRDLGVLFRLHAARWGADRFPPSLRAFHLDFAAIAAERGWLRLHTLEVDGQPAAMLYGWRLNTRTFAYSTAFDPAFARHAVGIVLLAAAVEHAALEGCERYDMLRGDGPHKQRFHLRRRTLESRLVARRRSRALPEALARSCTRRAWMRLPVRARSSIRQLLGK